jgi:type I restriction enzyme M protein
LKADYILANPPFNVSDWGGKHLREDSRWIYGTPPVGNANYAWIQDIISLLAPSGIAGFVLANDSMSSNQSGEGEIRKALIEGDLIDCMVALPGQLFYNTQIPACLWFLTRNKDKSPLTPLTKGGIGMRQRKGETLFIDARKLGVLIDRVHRELTEEEIKRIVDTYHAWRSHEGNYEDIPGFCKSATLEEIRGHGYVLTPGRYVGAEVTDDDDEPFAEKMERLTKVLQEQFTESARLEAEIKLNLRRLGL